MMENHVRVAELDDFKSVQKLLHDMFLLFPEGQDTEYPYTPRGIAYIRDRLENGAAFFSSDDSETGNPAGILLGSIEAAPGFKDFDEVGFIENLYVDPAFRGRGIARNLIDGFIKYCRNRDVEVIQTDSDCRQDLINFYTGSSFRITGVTYQMDIRER